MKSAKAHAPFLVMWGLAVVLLMQLADQILIL